ncbi:jg25543 [Pararge aegeria aegeria]|uniref:Jg25543 protein n=1 Tax=Pararge aegeria aegeria TaxID=348720 RepID=A0A8S4QQA2_9NEOP|nr:jg25543 [Pararge aegeria aegeria]
MINLLFKSQLFNGKSTLPENAPVSTRNVRKEYTAEDLFGVEYRVRLRTEQILLLFVEYNTNKAGESDIKAEPSYHLLTGLWLSSLTLYRPF